MKNNNAKRTLFIRIAFLLAVQFVILSTISAQSNDADTPRTSDNSTTSGETDSEKSTDKDEPKQSTDESVTSEIPVDSPLPAQPDVREPIDSRIAPSPSPSPAERIESTSSTPSVETTHFSDDSAESRYPNRNYAFFVSALKELGFGAGLRVRFDSVAVEASAGAALYLIMVEGICEELKLGFSPRYTGSLLFFFSNDDRRFQNGIRLAGFYDGLFGPGGSLGWIGEKRLGSLVALQIGAGIQIHPEGEERAEKKIAPFV